MTERRLHAVLLPRRGVSADGHSTVGRLLDLLGAALDGSGPAILPLDPELPPARLDALIEALAPDTVETADGLTRLAGSLDQLGLAQRADEPSGLAPDTAVVIATSGSTGEPKGAELSAAALLHSARATLDRVGARPGQRWLCCLSPAHVAGIQVLVRSLVAGTVPVMIDRVDADGLASSGCSHISLVPAQLTRLMDESAGGPEPKIVLSTNQLPAAAAASAGAVAALARFQSVLLGGAAAPAGLVAAAREAGIPVTTTYGMTETCGGCVYDGVPLDGVSVATEADGRIRIAGPVLFSGYRRRPDLTAAALQDGWFVTSDLGKVDQSGHLLVRGRADDVINTGGQKVVAGEVAAVLETCPGVREVVVIGRPDPQWGERVTAVVVPVDPADPPALDLLRKHVQASLPRYAAPRQVELVDVIPLLASGKPDLMALRREQSAAKSVT
jgi:O-succinylbenzoic acid--CoA ligase